jgi:G3E family GTPase
LRLDGVVSIADAEGLVRFPALGHTMRMHIESADLLLLNKVDLIQERELQGLEQKLRAINKIAPILLTTRCQVDADVLFGLAPERSAEPPHHAHQPEFAQVILDN